MDKQFINMVELVREKIKDAGYRLQPGLVTLHQLSVLSEEVGELSKAFRVYDKRARTSESDSRYAAFKRIEDEAADVYITLRVLTTELGINLDEAVERKLDAIKDRGGL